MTEAERIPEQLRVAAELLHAAAARIEHLEAGDEVRRLRAERDRLRREIGVLRVQVDALRREQVAVPGEGWA